MKRQVMLCALLVSFSSLPSPLSAQETPAAAAERQEAEERYKRMSADIEDLKTTIQSYQQRLNEQREEIRKLYEELARANSNKDYATRDDLKRLADKIREVDEKRLADDAKVTAKLAHLGELLSAPPKTSPPSASPTKVKVEPKGGDEKGLSYTIRSNDNPRVIVKTLAKEGIKVTQQQIIDANPAVVWTKLRIGQKIFIPASSPP